MKIANGVDPGIEFQTITRERLLEEEVKLQRELQRKELAKAEAKTEKKEKEIDTSRIALSDHSLKELLFLISSRGNSSTVEKLAELLKKERELLARLKK
ncbi:MAG: hypothetical protein ACP5Q5_04680 [Brevinematia bacterium]